MNMVRNEDTFTQSFRTAKGVQTSFFFFRFWGHSRLWPQNQKKASPDPFHENMVRNGYTAKYLVRTNFFMGPGPFFSVV